MRPLILLAAALYAQTSPTFRADSQLVTVPCTVLDGDGKPVNGLTREEFRVFDNGTQRIVQDLWMDDQPLTLGILIDTSESQSDQSAEHRQAALAILQQVLRPGDRAFVIAVNEDIRVWSDYGATAEEVGRKMATGAGTRLGTPCAQRPSGIPAAGPVSTCGGSPLWDAVFETARLKLASAPGNHALLILTDGFDTGSTHTWRQAADEAARAQASVFVIQYPSSLGGRFAPDLTRLIEESGGAWFGPPAGAYAAIVSRLDTDLRHRYVLSIRPDSASRKLVHAIRVEVTRPGLRVRARTAYVLTP